MKSLISLLLLCFLLLCSMTPVSLTCELQTAPTAINTSTPRFAWKLLSDTPGDRQTAYRIRIVSASDDQVVWDSGKKKSAESQFIPYSGKTALLPGAAYRWKVSVWDSRGKRSESEETTFAIAPDMTQSQAQWIGAITRKEAHLPIGRRDLASPSFKNAEHKALFDAVDPLALRSINLRKPFTLNKEVKQALLHVSGLGHYNLYLNGKRISDDIFTPLWSDYDKTLYYNTYEVDTILLKGENAIGVTLGNGFFNAVGSRYRKLWISFGPPTLFLEMRVEYTDGTSETICSDSSWHYDLSPIVFNDIYGGEDYDARLEQPGWNAPGFDASAWKPVVVQEAPQGTLRAQQLSPVRVMENFSAVSMEKIDSVYLFDMGQNLSGFPQIKLSGERGQAVRLIVGEQLEKETGLVSQRQSGRPHVYTYTLKGEGIETWQPEFAYYGFRYIQVEGVSLLDQADDKPQLLGLQSRFIYNSTAANGTFESSNELFNQAHTLIINAMKSNMQAVFTDCPHREKLGWLEQTQLVGPGLLFNWDMTRFYPKIMQDIADAQLPNGMVPTTAPEYVVFQEPYDMFRDSPEWGIASIMIPWLYYQYYGDNSLLVKYYDVMKRYVDYLTSRAEDHILNIGLGDWYDYGEHRAGFTMNSPVEVSATAHYYYAAHLLSEAAGLLKNQADKKSYASLAQEIRSAFNREFFDEATNRYGSGSQFCNAVAIYMNLVEPKHKAAVMESLKADIAKHGNRLTTGDVGNRYLFLALAMNGENELMYTMNNHYDAPGYGFQIQFGATTLTEQWDPRKGASWNHFMMGQIDEWFYRFLAGITPLEQGFKTFRIQPNPVGDLTWVKATYTTLYGDIKVHWTREDDSFTLHLTVPVGTTAQVILPDGSQKRVSSGNYEFKLARIGGAN